MKAKQVIALFIAALIFIGTGIASVYTNTTLKPLFESEVESIVYDSEYYTPFYDYVALIRVEGTISETITETAILSESFYDHEYILDYIDFLAYDDYNRGILLYINSPGGSVYASDELYLALEEYKELTERPIYCYYGPTACSGGVYVSMAADNICANRNTMTGSIGVIMQTYDLTGLYDKLGIVENNVTSGDNKAMGSSGEKLTDEQKDILQSVVDESYDQFVEIVADGRGMSTKKVKELADGRIYTAKQALDAGLIDRIETFEEYEERICGHFAEDVYVYEAPASNVSWLYRFFAGVSEKLPQSDMQALIDYKDSLRSGVWYYAE